LICERIFFNANKDLDTSPPADAFCIYDGKQIQMAQRIYIAIHYKHWHWRAGKACLRAVHKGVSQLNVTLYLFCCYDVSQKFDGMAPYAQHFRNLRQDVLPNPFAMHFRKYALQLCSNSRMLIKSES